jgi:hypothetical protein
MRSSLQALVWEIWRRGWKIAIVISALGALCATINHVVPDKKYLLRNFEAVYWLLMVVSLFLTFSVFHYAEHNRAKNWNGFPYRLFWLPVPTGLLVACPMVLGVISVEAVYWVWAKLVFGPLGRAVSFWPAACVGVGMICYQAIVWGLAGFRITRMIVLSFTGLLLIDLGMAPLFEEVKIWSEQEIYRWATITLVLMGVIGAFAAWFLVERQRRGGGRGRGWIRQCLIRAIDSLPRRTRPFGSPAQAQFWFEWRRCGQLLPMCSAAVLLLVCAPLSWFTRGGGDSISLTVGWALAAPLVLSAVIGKGFGKPDFWSTDLSVPPFLAVRPFASGEMIVTKMKVAMLSVVITWALVIAFLSCYLSLWADRKNLHDIWKAALMIYTPGELGVIGILGLLAAAIFSWRMLVGGLWISVCGNIRLSIGYAAVQIGAVVLFVWGIARASRFPFTVVNQTIHNLRWIGWALVAVAVLKLALSFWSWRRITPTRTRTYMVLWWAGTICLVGFVLAINPRFGAIKHVCILVAFLPLPLARLGMAPTLLANNRHRK